MAHGFRYLTREPVRYPDLWPLPESRTSPGTFVAPVLIPLPLDHKAQIDLGDVRIPLGPQLPAAYRRSEEVPPCP